MRNRESGEEKERATAKKSSFSFLPHLPETVGRTASSTSAATSASWTISVRSRRKKRSYFVVAALLSFFSPSSDCDHNSRASPEIISIRKSYRQSRAIAMENSKYYTRVLPPLWIFPCERPRTRRSRFLLCPVIVLCTLGFHFPNLCQEDFYASLLLSSTFSHCAGSVAGLVSVYYYRWNFCHLCNREFN